MTWSRDVVFTSVQTFIEVDLSITPPLVLMELL
jgi:hypothetical protein